MQHWRQDLGLTRGTELPPPKPLPEAAFVLLVAEWWGEEEAGVLGPRGEWSS